MTGILVLDKPEGFTSHDCVAKLRGMLKERRIGHGGTLDPMATGVLPILVGRATRAMQFIQADTKQYIAGLRLGIQTDTYDITGTVTQISRNHIPESEVREVICGFLGKNMQLPPMYSAVKINGRKLYELAREGKTVERTPREIFIDELEILSAGECDYVLKIGCSKGTYIRTLLHDIGLRLGTGGVMTSLRRTRVGTLTLEHAVTFEQIAKAQTPESILQPVDSVFSGHSVLTLNSADSKKCCNGAVITLPGQLQGRYRVYDAEGAFLMLGDLDSAGNLCTVKNFFDTLGKGGN